MSGGQAVRVRQGRLAVHLARLRYQRNATIILMRLSAILLQFIAMTLLPASTPARDLHAVIMSTSQFWFNYRHTSNALTIYHMLRRSGHVLHIGPRPALFL